MIMIKKYEAPLDDVQEVKKQLSIQNDDYVSLITELLRENRIADAMVTIDDVYNPYTSDAFFKVFCATYGITTILDLMQNGTGTLSDAYVLNTINLNGCFISLPEEVEELGDNLFCTDNNLGGIYFPREDGHYFISEDAFFSIRNKPIHLVFKHLTKKVEEQLYNNDGHLLPGIKDITDNVNPETLAESDIVTIVE